MKGLMKLQLIPCLLMLTIITTVIMIDLYFCPNRQVKVEYKNFPNQYVGNFSITHYCSCPKCTGTPKGSKTSTGHYPKEGRTVAVDKNIIPLHSIIYIEDVGYFVAEDVGGGVKKNHIDIYVDNHEDAVKLGTLKGEKKRVYILKEM